MRSGLGACLSTLLLCAHGCGGEMFTASGDAGANGGAAGSSVGPSGAGGVAGATIGTGGAGVGGGSGGTGLGGSAGSGVGGGSGGSSAGGRDSGGGGGTVVTDSGPPRDAVADTSNSDGTVAVDAGSPCGLTPGLASHVNGSNLPQFAVSHTVVGSNRLLIVALAIRHDTGVPNAIPSPTEVTFGASPLTRLKLATDGYYQAAELWTLVAPPLGANPVTVKFASAPQQTAVGVMSFTGAAQTGTFGAAAVVASVGTSATLSVPSTGFAAVIDLLSHGGIQTWTAAAGQQELWRDGTATVHGYSSFTRVVGTATSRSWTGSAQANYALIGVPIAEVRCP